MSDQERPQFLPPEDPSEERPEEPDSRPLLPGLDGAPAAPAADDADGPVRRRLRFSQRDRLALVVIAVSAAGLVLLGGLVFLHSGTTKPSLATGTPGARPSPPADTDYASLPDPCAAVGAALPRDVRAVKPQRFAHSCMWRFLRSDRSRSLDVDLQLERTDATLGTSGSVAAAKDFADDLAYAGDAHRNGGFEHDPERLDGLGDEAFAAQASNLIVSGRTKRSARSYDMGGAQVEVRRRNVVVSVKWRGADYPRAISGSKRLVGTRLAYSDARRQAVAVANALLGALR